MTYKKKLIEVAIPLEAINAASAREKSIRHGHPSTLHLWWARRPLAACRAVLFAQLVDDPSSRVDELLADSKLRAQAETELPERLAAWENSKASAQRAAANAHEPTLEDVAVEIERKRLFAIIEDLVKWENSTNEEVLERARAEIRKSCGGELPPVYDPFSGGGSIPLEAQRLGLPAYGSDLNPVAVMIGSGRSYRKIIEEERRRARERAKRRAERERRRAQRANHNGLSPTQTDVPEETPRE